MLRSRDQDGGWAWVVLCACAMCVMLTSGFAIVAGMFQKVFLEEFGGDVIITSWVTSLYASLLQLAGPVTGVVCSVFSCRCSVMAGSVLLSVGLIVSSFCESITTLLFTFGICSGLGLGLIYSAAIVRVNFSFIRDRPVAVGSVLAAGGMGIMAMPVLCEYLLDAYSWWETLGILSALSAQLVVAGALLFPVPAGDSYRSNAGVSRNHPNCSFKTQEQPAKHLQDKIVSSGKPLTGDGTSSPKDSNKAGYQHSIMKLEHSNHEVGEREGYFGEQHGANGSEGDEKAMHPMVSEIQNSDGYNLTSEGTDTLFKAEHLLKKITAIRGQNNQQDFHNKKLLTQNQATDMKNHPLAQENVILLSNSVKSVHSASGVAKLSNSIKNMELVFLTGSTGSLHSKLNSTVELSNASTSQVFYKVLTSPSLMAICLQLFLSNAAIGIVLVHYVNFCLENGSDFETVSLSFSMHGLALTLARFLLGSLVQDRNVDPLSVYVGLALVTTLLILLTPVVALTDVAQVAMQGALGVYSGGSYALLTEITIHCTGVDTLSLAFGMEMISAGLGFLVAPPIAGWIVVLTRSYDNAIFLAGSISLISVFVAMVISLKRPVWEPPEVDVADSFVTSGADVKIARSDNK